MRAGMQSLFLRVSRFAALAAFAAVAIWGWNLTSHPSVELVYVWSAGMPLSVAGIDEIQAAGRSLGIPVRVVDAETLYNPTSPETVDLVAAGATVHFPSLVIYREGRRLGDAILGYKKAAAYQGVLRRALLRRETALYQIKAASTQSPTKVTNLESIDNSRAALSQDIPIDGRPAPYFKVVPGTEWIAWAMDNKVHLLNYRSGLRKNAPGYIDFIPSPDGRFFVTPGRKELEFYDAREVLAAGPRDGLQRGPSPRVLYADASMPDQYPSIGILSSSADAQVVKYRILTSWFTGVVYRDYEIDWRPRNGPVIRPLAPKRVPCEGVHLSLPFISRDGREIGGRDEGTSTTKIYQLDDNGDCKETLDVGLQTGKIAFGPGGRRIAFAIPNGVKSKATATDMPGVFVFDRDSGRLARLEGSADANRMAFPDFVGEDRIMYLAAGRDNLPARFRLVCCLESSSK